VTDMVCPKCGSVDTVELSDGIMMRCMACLSASHRPTTDWRDEQQAEHEELTELLRLLDYDPTDEGLDECLGDHEIYWSVERCEWYSFSPMGDVVIVDRLEAMRDIAARAVEAELPDVRYRIGLTTPSIRQWITRLPPPGRTKYEISRDPDEALLFTSRDEAEASRPPNREYVVEEVS
jgi:hypothetical protein